MYLTRNFRTVPEIGSAHHTVPAFCGVLVHIFPIGLESGCHCDKIIVSQGDTDKDMFALLYLQR